LTATQTARRRHRPHRVGRCRLSRL